MLRLFGKAYWLYRLGFNAIREHDSRTANAVPLFVRDDVDRMMKHLP